MIKKEYQNIMNEFKFKYRYTNKLNKEKMIILKLIEIHYKNLLFNVESLMRFLNNKKEHFLNRNGIYRFLVLLQERFLELE